MALVMPIFLVFYFYNMKGFRMDDDNIFDDDEALDYIMYEEVEKNVENNSNEKSGCLGVLALTVCPVTYVLIKYL